MAQVWIDIEDNENCGYYPTQTFEVRGTAESGSAVEVDELPGAKEPQRIVGWCSDDGGSACEVTVVTIGDSGAGESRLIKGGDHGVRIRPATVNGPWSINTLAEHGEPYVLLDSEAHYRVIE